jgi:hypothetical protein
MTDHVSDTEVAKCVIISFRKLSAAVLEGKGEAITTNSGHSSLEQGCAKSGP